MKTDPWSHLYLIQKGLYALKLCFLGGDFFRVFDERGVDDLRSVNTLNRSFFKCLTNRSTTNFFIRCFEFGSFKNLMKPNETEE
jgi:hypothetical protein